MSVYYRIVEHPKTTLYETAAEAYLIVEGPSKLYRLDRLNTKYHKKSTPCHRYVDGGSKDLTDVYFCKRAQKERQDNASSCVHTRKARKNSKQNQRSRQASARSQEKDIPTFHDIQPKGQSSRAKVISCSYQKQIENENINLRRENNFLQDYIRTLEEKDRGTVPAKRRASGTNCRSHAEDKDIEESSYFTKFQSTRGQSDWNGHR